MGGIVDDRVTEYNPRTITWRNMSSLQLGRGGHSVCILDNKIFSLGGYDFGDCEMLDLSDNDPQWIYMAEMNKKHYDGGAVVIEKKVYVLGEEEEKEIYVLGGRTTSVHISRFISKYCIGPSYSGTSCVWAANRLMLGSEAELLKLSSYDVW